MRPIPVAYDLILKAHWDLSDKMALVHYHDSESEDDDFVMTPVDKMPPGLGERLVCNGAHKLILTPRLLNCV